MTTPAPHAHPDTGAPEHPTATAAFERLLLDVPPSGPPPLLVARSHMAALQEKHDAILAEAEEAGSDGELEHTPEWRWLCRDLESARRNVASLEAASLPQPKTEI